MSHQSERKEKNCLNCGAEVAGRYCQTCGQENIERHMGVWALIKHFIYDIFHFDGKFFDTLKYLFIRPGYVAKQYVSGKRVSFLDPIRMYLFTSAIFFLLFFVFAGTQGNFNVTGINELSKAERFDLAGRYASDSIADVKGTTNPLQILLDSNYAIASEIESNDYIPYDTIYSIQWKQSGVLLGARKDSVPGLMNTGSGRLGKSLETKWKSYKQRFGGDTDAMLRDFFGKVAHRFPYFLFLSLPFFAVVLKLLYLRRKTFFYYDHAVFTLYHYIFSFLLLLVVLSINEIEDKYGWGVLDLLIGLLILSWPVHLLIAIKRFYVQGWGRSILKFLMLNVLASLAMFILFLAFLFYSVITV